MLVFWKARLVMLAVPKTGSTAYARALGPHAGMVVSDPPELKHAPVYRYNRFFRPMFAKMGAEEMEVVAVIREPISWLGSWYRYRQRPFLDGKRVSTRDLSFDAFVDAYCRGERPPFASVGSQAKFVEPRPNGTEVTRFFRYEDQGRIVAFLEDRLGISLDLPRENVSPRRDLALSPEIEAKLRRKCAADFALWEGIAPQG
ncbi:gamma-glutamyl kinase [Roseivivax sp. GX 12232]|uniref:gamma-glutamyl kinase n=1 Tax=Roseivivax sp. GX 12232 TaxID=2900547 RepID=UPI001E350869|nr:gamma-glutamyl kinase [Roseivivax sp. GX 12232]MCE0506534.1 gamma-glutamyl kinase [Roseivivax sp. GX 12232]